MALSVINASTAPGQFTLSPMGWKRWRLSLGRTPKEEILRIQIERAKQLLTLTEMTAQDVCAKCGFSEPKYFSHVFHAKVGMAPGVYRKHNRS